MFDFNYLENAENNKLTFHEVSVSNRIQEVSIQRMMFSRSLGSKTRSLSTPFQINTVLYQRNYGVIHVF